MKVLIVDDEPLIAKGIQHIIQQFDCEFNEVQACFSGKQALEILRKSHFDLLITDIAMPEISGIELIQQVKEEQLCSNYCILTGYSEFSYAKSAISLGVREYLLKPVNKQELKKALDLFSEKINKDCKDTRDLGEHQISEFLFSGTSIDLTILDIPRPACFSVISSLFLPSSTPIAKQKFSFLLENETVKYIIQIRNLQAMLFIANESKISALTQEISQKYPQCFLGIYKGIVENPDQLLEAYQTAVMNVMGAQFILQQKSNYSNLSSKTSPYVSLPELKSEIKKQYHMDIPDDQLIMYQICCKNLMPFSSSSKDTPRSSNVYVSQMMKYIADHYKTEMSLSDASKFININSDYAGKLFKNETGSSFSEYLNKYRISKILNCILQNPSFTFEQLAPHMGFPDMRNFYRVFKRIMNTTPAEYISNIKSVKS